MVVFVIIIMVLLLTLCSHFLTDDKAPVFLGSSSASLSAAGECV